jgi:hypothetical protein
VERADDLAVVDGAAVAQVGAEMGAEGVVDVHLAALVAPADQVAGEVVERLGLTGREVLGVADAEPAERDGEGVAMLHRSCPRGRRDHATTLEHVSILVENGLGPWRFSRLACDFGAVDHAKRKSRDFPAKSG